MTKPLTYAKNDHAGFLFDTLFRKKRFTGLDKLSMFATMPARRLAFFVMGNRTKKNLK